jgi:hypothetical protein
MTATAGRQYGQERSGHLLSPQSQHSARSSSAKVQPWPSGADGSGWPCPTFTRIPVGRPKILSCSYVPATGAVSPGACSGRCAVMQPHRSCRGDPCLSQTIPCCAPVGAWSRDRRGGARWKVPAPQQGTRPATRPPPGGPCGPTAAVCGPGPEPPPPRRCSRAHRSTACWTAAMPPPES